MLRRRIHREDRRRGAAMLEFGLWLPIIMTLLSGIIDFSWYMAQVENVSRASRDGARRGAATRELPSDAPGSAIVPAAETYARATLDGVGMGCGAGCTVDAQVYFWNGLKTLQVDVVYPFNPLIGILPMNTTIASSFTMMAEIQ